MMQEKNQAVYPVEIVGLSKEYRSGRQRIMGLSNVSLTVASGEFLAVMGASGSGKSTLLHLIAGLTEPTAGTVKINDVDLYHLRDAVRTRFRLENIGIVFQSFNLIPTLTAVENIMLPSLIEGKKRITPAQCNELLELLELSERQHHRPDSLSGGEQQRVAIGRALSMNPSLVLADEPTGNLDSANGERLCKLLRNLCDKQRRTLIVVTHEKSVADWSDRCLKLKDGTIDGHVCNLP